MKKTIKRRRTAKQAPVGNVRRELVFCLSGSMKFAFPQNRGGQRETGAQRAFHAAHHVFAERSDPPTQTRTVERADLLQKHDRRAPKPALRRRNDDMRRQRRLASAGGLSLRRSPLPFRPSFVNPDSRLAFLRCPLAIFVHHCRHNSSNIPPVRKHSQVTNHARCKKVFAGRAGDRNIPRPPTPGNPQHPRRRLPELRQRHPSPGGRACPHQFPSKTIRNPQSSRSST